MPKGGVPKSGSTLANSKTELGDGFWSRWLTFRLVMNMREERAFVNVGSLSISLTTVFFVHLVVCASLRCALVNSIIVI